MVTAHVRGQKPLHETAQVTVSMGPEHEMNVIRHEAVGEHPHREPFAGGGQELHEGIVIGVLVKDLGAGVTAVDDVVTDPTDRGPGRARHEASVAELCASEK